MRGQEAALAGKHQEINSRVSILGALRKEAKNEKAALIQAHKLYLDEAMAAVEKKKQENISIEQKNLIDELGFNIIAAQRKAVSDIKSAIHEGSLDRVSRLQTVEYKKDLHPGKIESVKTMNALRLARAQAITKKEDRLPSAMENIRQQHFKWIPIVKRMKTLWGMAKDAGSIKRFIAKYGGGKIPGGVFDPKGEFGALLQLRKEIETMAAASAKMGGNSGGITEAEQTRGKMEFPDDDRYKHGVERYDWLITRLHLGSLRAWYNLNDRMRGEIIGNILKFRDDKDGLIKQVSYMKSLIGRLSVTGEETTESLIAGGKEQDLALGFKVDKEGGPSPSTGQGSQVAEEEKLVNTDVLSGVPLVD